MEFIPLHTVLFALAEKETRQLVILQETGGLPEGIYCFIDSYCSDQKCDCRRTFINVFCIEGALEGRHLATIGYGWETAGFYTKWMHGDSKIGKQMTGTALESMQVQSEYAPLAFAAFHKFILDDAYTQRIQKHYAAFKEEIRRRATEGKKAKKRR
ncbi:MAG: hypothetical protein WCG83_04610 [Candidatus Peregrinibacteria bacterium]